MTINAFWQQGEVQAGRASARPFVVEPGWSQGAMVPPACLEVRLRLGFIPADHHGRWMIEVLDPATKELLAMYSTPHFAISQLEEEMAAVGVRLAVLVDSYLDPDPFP